MILLFTGSHCACGPIVQYPAETQEMPTTIDAQWQTRIQLEIPHSARSMKLQQSLPTSIHYTNSPESAAKRRRG